MSRRKPPAAVRRRENGRLAYYRTAAVESFWADHWTEVAAAELYHEAERGELGPLGRIFKKWLPREGRILEGGCGLGQHVLALRRLGYNCEGVEYAKETVEHVNRARPEIPLRWGDVTALDVPDNTYSAYISLGVVEHRREGPEPFLREAHRILTRGGLLLISVPHFNFVRRVKALLGNYGGELEDREFYQWAFRPTEMRGLLETQGFDVLGIDGYDSVRGLLREIPGLRALSRKRLFLRNWGRLTRRVFAFERRFGHMAMFICRKRSSH